MEHLCRTIKLLFLLLMLLRVPTIICWPLRGAPQSDLIAGNEFLKLFLEHDAVQKDLHSGVFQEDGGAAGGSTSRSTYGRSTRHINDNSEDAEVTENTSTWKLPSRNTSARSLDYKSRHTNEQETRDDSKQLVKLVTSGSKIVFLEEYDDDDAVVDAVARDIDLQKEPIRKESTRNEFIVKDINKKDKSSENIEYALKNSWRPTGSNPRDEYKVVAVSVSSSSKRANSRERPTVDLQSSSSSKVKNFPELSFYRRNKNPASIDTDRGQRQTDVVKNQLSEKVTSSTAKSVTMTRTTLSTTLKTTKARTTTTTPQPTTTIIATRAAAPADDFINRSYKSELSIEEAEPLTMSQRDFSRRPTASSSSNIDTFYDTDSENSASTNIQNVLAAPLVRSTPPTIATGGASMYHSRGRNSTASLRSRVTHAEIVNSDDNDDDMTETSSTADVVEDKLLPFQTVIYHDTKDGGHGPQSRSISYSSISQNVEDLHAWQKSGILAEAQRNVSESLKPVVRQLDAHEGSEPSKYYSVPSKMYSVPSKFYSEPAKVYSEPAKVYGQPEKVYSEPAKVYGQPSKFYSEPSKVYSQPAKVYSEPAKTYWPRPLPSLTTSTTTTMTSTTTTASPPTTISSSGTTGSSTTSSFATLSSRRPAIVSRIAFGEAQTTQSTVPTTTGRRPSLSSNRYHSQGNANSQPRRILFNLDKLPYDLLNAPEQSPKHLLAVDRSKQDPSTSSGGGGYYGVGRQRPCLETATSSTSQQRQQQQQHHQQHSSLLDQHSDQNAKGLPNRDLVKCVSQYPHSSSAASTRPPTYTTERNRIEELYTPTPEQNYEIEESVSVMSNGRAHGLQGTLPTTTPSHIRGNVGAGAGNGGGGVTGIGGGGNSGTQRGSTYNANSNVNDDYDDDNNNDEDEEAATADNYDDDQSENNNNNNNNNGGDQNNKNTNDNHDKDDSKVAYVVEGRNYRKYRVEERTVDGFTVGEYGVVDHNGGNIRGVRYTADSTINRSLIQKALLTFLKL